MYLEVGTLFHVLIYNLLTSIIEKRYRNRSKKACNITATEHYVTEFLHSFSTLIVVSTVLYKKW